ncbi:MAG: hypothetical protein ACTSV7_04490 [Candidatus Baldrarchaeia archaeon]
MAAHKVWTKKEVAYLEKKVNAGVHPHDFIDDLNKRFGNKRSFSSVEKKVSRMGLSLAGCERALAVPTVEESKTIVKKDIELTRVKAEKSILLKKYKHAIKASSMQEVILEYLHEHIQALPEVPTPKPRKIEFTDSSEEELILNLSDIHAGEIVNAEEMAGLNEYNFHIMSHRLKALADTVVDISKNKLRGYQFHKLHILGLGDWISGTIKDELVESSEGNVIEWTMNLAYIVSQMIRELAVEFEEIVFAGVIGNHGRLHKKPRFKARYVNWDYVCYQMISALLFKQKNVKCIIPKSFWYIHEVNNHKFLLIHGDNILSNLGIPWYGINRMVANFKELLASKEQHFDYIMLGHFHNYGLLDRVKGELLINGSLIGGNEYSVGKMFTSSEACQHFCGVHPKRGMTFRYKVNVQHIDTSGESPYKYVADQTLGELV